MPSRLVLSVLLIALVLGGCATRPMAPLSPERQKFRNQETRLLFARLIAGHRTTGSGNIFLGERQYSNARVSLPAEADGNTGTLTRICAKVMITPFSVLGAQEVDLSADVIEGPSGVRLTMGQGYDFFGPRCEGTYVPFPELEALGVKK